LHKSIENVPQGLTLAMMLVEHFPMLAGWKFSIEGTDISREVVERAQAPTWHDPVR